MTKTSRLQKARRNRGKELWPFKEKVFFAHSAEQQRTVTIRALTKTDAAKYLGKGWKIDHDNAPDQSANFVANFDLTLT